MEEKKSNRSLFLYTALIFIAAIAVITLSFFSQINAEKSREALLVKEKNANSIIEKTAQLSEENRILLETTNSLNKKIEELTNENSEMAERILSLDKQMNNAKIMYDVFNNIQIGDIKQAAKDFESLDPIFFTEEQEIFYNYLQKRIRKLY